MNKKKLVVIHHNDADGRCAAAIVGRGKGLSDYSPADVTYIEADYARVKDQQWLAQTIEMAAAAERVFVVDFVLPPGVMDNLDKTTDLIWIDHHASAKNRPSSFKGTRDFTNKGPAACELAWAYIHGPDFGVPKIVKLIGDFDTFRLEYEDQCKPMILALDAEQYGPENIFWDEVLCDGSLADSMVRDLVDDGKVMRLYRDGWCSGGRKAFGFETVFHDLRCFAVNIQRLGSDGFGPELDSHDAGLAFVFDGNLWTVSMYSKNPQVDCAAICALHGGGGHKGAAGFTCEALPFQRKN